MIVVMYSCLFMHVYIGIMPMNTYQHNYLHFIEETVILISVLHILTFTDWVLDEQVRYSYGWSMILIITIHMVIIYIWLIL